MTLLGMIPDKAVDSGGEKRRCNSVAAGVAHRKENVSVGFGLDGCVIAAEPIGFAVAHGNL